MINNRNPDFENLKMVLQNKKPDRPTLFEFFMNRPLYEKIAGYIIKADNEDEVFKSMNEISINANYKAGYDYATIVSSKFRFPVKKTPTKSTYSINEMSLIQDDETFKKYKWPNPDNFDYSELERLKDKIPKGMKLIVPGPGGILENVISIVGYERLCIMMAENESLVSKIFGCVGERLVRHYELCLDHVSVGGAISNDDWGFKTQTLLSPKQMKKYVFPWHKMIVKTIHSFNKPAILHSCGNLNEIMDIVIGDIGYDAKHSFEDAIIPVEEAYKLWGDRIAILGGIDIDFICRSTKKEIARRSKNMLKMSQKKGGYALGTGNSVPEYVPDDKYFAMIDVVFE